jgi:hypothetical protein
MHNISGKGHHFKEANREEELTPSPGVGSFVSGGQGAISVGATSLDNQGLALTDTDRSGR